MNTRQQKRNDRRAQLQGKLAKVDAPIVPVIEEELVIDDVPVELPEVEVGDSPVE